MRRPALAFLLLLGGCGSSPPIAEAPKSACAARMFEESRFTICSVKGGTVEIRTSTGNGQPYRTFIALEAGLGKRADRVAFAMNAGMFDEQGDAIGLLIEDGKQLDAINRRKGGGNFHLLPNGVFLVRKSGKSEVVASQDFKPADDIQFATQSGPMLVIDGKLHPKFDADGQSRYTRNGVGIAPDGTPVFVIADDPVSFGKLARLFRDGLHAKNALYFDGSVSSLWDPVDGRRDTHSPLGPTVVVFKPAESAPGREGRATP
jgi:uncharacterized protein YigE (DUF2233 family)